MKVDETYHWLLRQTNNYSHTNQLSEDMLQHYSDRLIDQVSIHHTGCTLPLLKLPEA